MNKTFKVIFSKTRGALVAVNEAAKTTSRASVKTAVAGVCAALLSVPAMAEGFTDYCQNGQCDVVGKTVEGDGSVVLLDNRDTASSKVKSITIKDSTISNTIFELRGSQKISVSDTVFTGLVSGQPRGFGIYAHNGYTTDVANEKATEVELNNVIFKDNKGSWGSLFVYDKTNLHMKDGAFDNNETTDIAGGAMIKSGTIVFEDVLFQNNVAKNDGSKLAAGGAVYVDITTGIKQNKKDSVGDVTFKLTKDMAYTGNKIVSSSTGTENTYGWYAYASGGFLFLDRYARGAFDIADGVTLTIGTASATGEDDSIASALPDTSAKKPGYSTLVKKGAGTVVMHGSMDKYFGDFTVEAGTFDVRKAWTSLGNTTVTGGVLSASNGITLDTMKAGTNLDFIQSGKLTVSGEGTVTVKSLKLANSAKATDGLPFVRIENGGTLRADTIDVADNAGTVTLAGGTLETGSAQVYDLATKSVINADASKVSSEKDLTGLALKAGITATSGTLALTDKGYYTTASLKAMSGALKASTASLSFLNSKLYKAAGETAELVDSVIQSTEQVTASSEVKTNADGKASAQVTVKNSGAQTVVVKDSAQKDAKAVDQVTFAAPENSTGEMTLVGSAAGGHLVQNTAGKAVDVEVAPDLTLNLGQTELPEQTTGTLSNLTLSTGTTDMPRKAAGLTVANIVAAVEKLVAAGNNLVTVGNERKRGVLKIGTLDLGAGSKVFVDPAWQNDAALNTIGNASHLEIAQVGSLRGSLIAGQNSLITIGATAAQAEAAFNQVGLNWGKEAVSAALYLGTSVNPEGGILVNGNLTSASDRLATTAEGTVNLAAGSLLMVDAAAVGEKAVTGTVSAADGAKVALVNAAEGTFKLADTVTGLTSASFVSDNLFTTTALNGSDVSTTVDKNALGGAVASMGLQSMIRRADSVLAATVADRTSIDQELGAGANLWVDVGGESYEADGFDNNASFKSDMGYGVFGADVAVSDNITLGAALQYGTGSARSSNFGMKNEIDTWGLTAYSVYKTGDARFVGEVAYVKAKNDISASAASKLSQSVDTEMLSAGMSAHYQFDAGAVTVTPSLGIRLSQLKTDALKVGAIRIADDEMTVFQVPVAVRVGMKPVEASGWNIAPAVKLAYVPTFGDDETDILGYQQKVLDTSPVQADIGVEARKGNFMVNVNFLAGTGSEGAKAVGGKVGVKYLF